MKNFFSGLSFTLSGFAYLKKNKNLRKWVWIPLLINFLVFIFAFWGSFSLVGGGVEYFMSVIVSWLSFLDPTGFIVTTLTLIFQVLFWLVSLVFLIFAAFILGTVLASPFNSLLAEKVLAQEGVYQSQDLSMISFIVLSLKMLVVSLIKALVFMILGIILFILSFIPGLNLVTSYATFLIMAFDCFDYSYEVLGYGLPKRFGRFKRDFLTGNGMACNLALTMFLPGATLLVLPFAVVGAAELLSKKVREK